MSYQTKRRVEFNHVDPAGIVFYPRYFEMINSVVENFFRDSLDISFAQMHMDQQMGVPTAHFDVDFEAPSKLEDMLDFELSVEEIGTSSALFVIRCTCDNQPRMTARQRVVYINLKDGKSQPWSPKLKQAMKQRMEAS